MVELKNGSKLQNGKYEITKVLGSGNFGITYLASTKIAVKGQMGQMDVTVNVAIKEFYMKDLNNRISDGSTVEGTQNKMVKNYRNRFKKEAENLAKLHHPNIVKVIEVFDENNTTYYVMEYIEGGSLDDYIKSKGRLTEEEALQCTLEIADALSYMHKNMMIHLDLKPKNIMRNSKGHLYLIDFGLSKQYDENGEPESSTSIGLGTPGYAPLEQASYKQDGTLPVTLDVYALGASLFKMLTGKTPPESSAILNEGFPLSSLEKVGISANTILIVEKAMASVKKDRYQSVSSVSKAIGNLTGNLEQTNFDEDKSSTSYDEGIEVNKVDTEEKNSHHIKVSSEIDKSKSERKRGLFKIMGAGLVISLLLFGILSRKLVPTLLFSFSATIVLAIASAILIHTTSLGWKRCGIIGGLLVLTLLLLFAISNIPLEIRDIVGYRTGDAEDMLIKNWNIGIIGHCLSLICLICCILFRKKVLGYISIIGVILSLSFIAYFVYSEYKSSNTPNLVEARSDNYTYLYDDGVTSSQIGRKGHQIVGVVFSNSTTDNDKKLGWQKGYAIALRNSAKNIKWCQDEWSYPDNLDTELSNNLDGLYNTNYLKKYDSPAVKSALGYDTSCSGKCSNWFLPSIGQLRLLCQSLGETNIKGASTNGANCVYNINKPLKRLIMEGYDVDTLTIEDRFWSSSVYTNIHAYMLRFYKNGQIQIYGNYGGYAAHVRPVIAF